MGYALNSGVRLLTRLYDMLPSRFALSPKFSWCDLRFVMPSANYARCITATVPM